MRVLKRALIRRLHPMVSFDDLTYGRLRTFTKEGPSVYSYPV